MKTLHAWFAAAAFAVSGSALAHPEPAKAVAPGSAPLAAHAQKDAQRHRAMAAAHESAARCFESGKTEEACHAELQVTCKGLALGKYCGMRHAH